MALDSETRTHLRHTIDAARRAQVLPPTAKPRARSVIPSMNRPASRKLDARSLTRQQKRLEARRLRAEGLTAPEIGRLLDVSDSTVRNWYLGDDCLDCGAPVDGSSRKYRSRRCSACHRAWERTEEACLLKTKWTRGRIVAAIREWARIYGRPPNAVDWAPSHARSIGDEARAYRFESDGCWPWFTMAVLRFGSWNAAIEAAGFEPNERTGAAKRWSERGEARRRKAAA